MGNRGTRYALWALVLLVLAGSLASVNAQAGSPPNYTLYGQTYIVNNASVVPGNITVDLISSASHQVYSTITNAGGAFAFSEANTSSTLAPGWWGLWIPPQAHVRSANFGTTQFAVLPSDPNPRYYYENATVLSSAAYHRVIPSIEVVGYTSTLAGNATLASGGAAKGAALRLLDPSYNGFVIANTTTNATTGAFSFAVPSGTWVLETRIQSGSLPSYNYTQVTVGSGTTTVNPVVRNYLTWGLIDSSSTGSPILTGSNVTLYDTGTHQIYSEWTPTPYYAVGTYPVNFVGSGAENFEVVISPMGYGTVSFPLSVSAASPSGGVTLPNTVTVPPVAPPATYATTLNFSQGFSSLSVATAAYLGNDSVFPELPNATVGQLWAQLALDFQHNVTFVPSSTWSTAFSWISSAGPFFPADQANTLVNGTTFTARGTPSIASSTPSGLLGLSSTTGLYLNYSQSYNASGKVPGNGSGKSYTVAFTFRYPTGAQQFNYTVDLPSGYVLRAGTQAPAHTQLLPAGPSGTWTAFTLVTKPSPQAFGIANFTIVKYSGVTANVNVSVPNFTFSQKNILNSTHGNYTAIVGVGENVTFSALNSTYPAGTNGSLFSWNFGDGSPTTSTVHPTTNHTYAAAGEHKGWLFLTASSGLTSNVSFTIYAGGTAPNIVIANNATASENQTTTGGAPYLFVNWSRSLSFNMSGSTASVCAGCPAGVISVSDWNLSVGGKMVQHGNYTAGSGQNPLSIFPVVLLGGGAYLTNGTVNGTAVPFLGWEYNLTLTLWDGTGHSAKKTIPILVKDTEKPTPVAVAKDAKGKTITGQTVTEGTNHTATVTVTAANSTDPHNGSIVSYRWNVTSKGNTSVNWTYTNKSQTLYLVPQANPYSFNLTVTDRAGNSAHTVVQVTVQIDRSTRPVLSVTNLTVPSGPLTAGSSYTIWANVTNTIGTNSTAENVSVAFYLLPPSGVGSHAAIAGSPASVQWYNYTKGVANSAPFATGKVSLKYNQTVRALVHWTVGRSGNFDLYANATASNEFVSDYTSGANLQHVAVTLKPNPITQYEQYGAIAGGVIIVIVAIVVLYRRRTGGGAKPSSGKTGLERGRREEEEEDEEP